MTVEESFTVKNAQKVNVAGHLWNFIGHADVGPPTSMPMISIEDGHELLFHPLGGVEVHWMFERTEAP